MDQKRAKTKSIYNEILLSLCPTTSISDAFKAFGLSNSTTDILVLVQCLDDGGPKDSQVLDQLKQVIQGTFIETFDLDDGLKDVKQLQKVLLLFPSI